MALAQDPREQWLVLPVFLMCHGRVLPAPILQLVLATSEGAQGDHVLVACLCSRARGIR